MHKAITNAVFLATLNLCSQQALAASDEVTVHFVPHSHMDAGWLQTYDEYYDR